MTLLAIDPGKRTGWALFTQDGELVRKGVLALDELSATMYARDDNLMGDEWFCFNDWRIDHVVIENYVNDPGTPQGGQENPAAEVIGAVCYVAKRTGVPVVRQRAADMHHAMKFVGYEEPKTRSGRKKHVPDEDSAYLHGVYYLVGRGLMKPLPL